MCRREYLAESTLAPSQFQQVILEASWKEEKKQKKSIKSREEKISGFDESGEPFGDKGMSTYGGINYISLIGLLVMAI